MDKIYKRIFCTISRLIYSFDFDKRPAYINALFGGFAITAITYFIIIKGLKGTPFYSNVKGLLVI